MQYNVKASANVDERSKSVKDKDKILIGIANLNKYILVPILYSSFIQIFFFLLRIAKMDEKRTILGITVVFGNREPCLWHP